MVNFHQQKEEGRNKALLLLGKTNPNRQDTLNVIGMIRMDNLELLLDQLGVLQCQF